MRIASPPRFMTAVRTDKETRLKDFIVAGVAGHDTNADAAGITLLVRNPDSPVARALLVAIADGQVPSAGLKVLFGETFHEEPAQLSLLDIEGAEFRVLNDSRLGHAHEQLVVGNHVWIGDCLRRDPTKRDAFELYCPADAKTQKHGAMSFRNLWSLAQTYTRPKAETVAPEIIANGQPANVQTRVHRN